MTVYIVYITHHLRGLPKSSFALQMLISNAMIMEEVEAAKAQQCR